MGGVIPATKATVPCLEGKEYEFRVSAVNDGGAGQPCKATKPHLCRVPIGKFEWKCCPANVSILNINFNEMLSIATVCRLIVCAAEYCQYESGFMA